VYPHELLVHNKKNRRTVSEAGPLKANRLLYHSTQRSGAPFRTCIESDEEEEEGFGLKTYRVPA
jgi:hypothetical protein